MLLFGVVLSTLVLAQVDQPFATARPRCGIRHWSSTAATGLTGEVLLPCEALNFGHRFNRRKLVDNLILSPIKPSEGSDFVICRITAVSRIPGTGRL